MDKMLNFSCNITLKELNFIMALYKDELLQKAKELLKKEMTEISYSTWIQNLEIKEITNDEIIFHVESVFQKELLETRYYDLLMNVFKFITNKSYKILIELDENSTESKETRTNLDNKFGYSNTSLNPRYTFDTFVVGNNNRLAHAAALAVTEALGAAYNPLFLYGGVGLGKTHLMHSIGNEILKNNKNAKVLYVTSEKFTNELINAIKDNTNEKFRNKYRNIDLLLIDDIQFIAKKDAVQEEFFHTFNTLYESGKQIVISSDKPPRDIQLLEDRLKSRFEWGLIADISNPDYETRLAILRKKADMDHIVIDDEILSNIASKVDSNIRELEGALNKIVAHASLANIPITLEMAEESINDIITKKERVISIEYIQDVVAKYFGIDIKDMKSSKKSNDIVFPRQIAMYLCRNIANASFPKIGDEFGKRDHTTVMHAVKKIEKEIKSNQNTKLIVDNVKKNLTA